MTDELLPELPEYGFDTASHAGFRVRGYTADQLRAFAREAIRLSQIRVIHHSHRCSQCENVDHVRIDLLPSAGEATP